MDYVTLGSTGIEVSVAGLGSGGASALGVATGSGSAAAVGLLREALARGVNFVDTAELYGTEVIVGQALRGMRRDSVVVATKVLVRAEGQLRSPQEIADAFHASLRRLSLEDIDIIYFHAVLPDDYAYARDELLPILEAEKGSGRARAIGLTEAFRSDPTHQMLELATADACWDVIMVGFNVLNQSARGSILERAREQGTGVVSVRSLGNAMRGTDEFNDVIGALVRDGLVDLPGFGSAADHASALVATAHAEDVPDMAYRFARHERGVDAVLFGTGSADHLAQNVRSLLRPDISQDGRLVLTNSFGHLTMPGGA